MATINPRNSELFNTGKLNYSIALDPSPYNGTTTTMESLWMDAKGFTKNLEAMYSSIWKDWCKRSKT